ncbi:uncharacterized protein V1513DRAFT_460383 [Lipomyces chichibuensis]|uniref:uncharacterized protein n=1 Tax=Lipomyces chichibuensis TaxID=1546026 RepID=UPI0033436E1D
MTEEITTYIKSQKQYIRAKMTEVFVDSTFGTNKHGYELYCVLTEYDLRGRRLTQWFTALQNTGLTPNTVHTDKDFLEVTAASIAFRTHNSRYNHHLCLWHRLRAIDQYLTGKTRGIGFDSADTVRASTRTTVLPSYLHFLTEESEWMLSSRETKKVVVDKSSAPASLYESYEDIHASSVREMLEYCRSIGKPRLFGWARWEIASLCGRPGSSESIPISRTTMRLESHWRILKKGYAFELLDVLTYIICTGLVRSRIHVYLQDEAGRVKPSLYEDFAPLWRQCVDAIDESVIDDRNNLYHADKRQWICSSPDSSDKHSVRARPRCTPDLFQQQLPLIRFDGDFDVGVVQSSNYMEELKSLQLLPSEDPEAQEENDERLMQRDLGDFIRKQQEFIARYKRPYEEAMGRKRSADSQTMRKAQKSYYYMRPQNHGQGSV